MALQGLNGCVGSPSLRQASHRCRGSARRLETAVAAVRKSVQPEDSGDLEEVWTGLGSFLTIRRWHWAAAAAAANVTRGARSITLAFAAALELCHGLARRLELFRWHLSYFLVAQLLPDMPVEVQFHDYCCSSGEVIASIVRQSGFTSDNITLAEVGVETGETSAELLALLPERVRLVGVDPFNYQVTAAQLTGLEKEQRELLSLRYKQWWLRGIEAAAEAVYSAAPERAELRKTTSAEAGERFIEGADLVFLDADHSSVAVARDIEVWLRVLVARPGVGRRVLAGHDFTLMFPGVLKNVLNLAAELRAGHGHLHGSGVLNLATNSVWWFNLRKL